MHTHSPCRRAQPSAEFGRPATRAACQRSRRPWLLIALMMAAPVLAARPEAEAAAADTSLLLPRLGAQIEAELQQRAPEGLRFVPLRIQQWHLRADGAHFRVLGELRALETAPREIEVHGLIARDSLALGPLRVADAEAAELLGLPSAGAAAAGPPRDDPTIEWQPLEQGLAQVKPEPRR